MLLEDCPERGIAIRRGALQVAGFPVPVDAIGIHIAAVSDNLLFESVRHLITNRHESMPERIRRDGADLVRFTILVPAVAKGLLTERLTLFVWKNPLGKPFRGHAVVCAVPRFPALQVRSAQWYGLRFHFYRL